MLHAGLTVPLTIILRTIWQCLHWNSIFLNAGLVILVVVATILEFGQSLPNLKHPRPLLLKLVWIHFNMDGATLKQAMRHFESIDFLYHSAC